MEIIDMITKRKLKKMMSVLFISGCFFIGNTKCKGADLEYISQETANYAVQERGYDLPVDEVVKEEAIEDCKNVMNQMKVIYQKPEDIQGIFCSVYLLLYQDVMRNVYVRNASKVSR